MGAEPNSVGMVIEVIEAAGMLSIADEMRSLFATATTGKDDVQLRRLGAAARSPNRGARGGHLQKNLSYAPLSL